MGPWQRGVRVRARACFLGKLKTFKILFFRLSNQSNRIAVESNTLSSASTVGAVAQWSYISSSVLLQAGKHNSSFCFLETFLLCVRSSAAVVALLTSPLVTSPRYNLVSCPRPAGGAGEPPPAGARA